MFTTRSLLADLRGEAGDVAGAVATAERLLADVTRVFGPEHPVPCGHAGNWPAGRGGRGTPPPLPPPCGRYAPTSDGSWAATTPTRSPPGWLW
ncbi:hypothetical protein DN402_07730 [Streptomyces sp. SW4]|nr:hypothetical protein DN402_07730 [Streptomyces sp. SW4]